jgi:peroxiredoxin
MRVAFLFLTVASILVAGCQKGGGEVPKASSAPTPEPAVAKTDQPQPEQHADEDEVKASLAKLSPEDRTLAEAQRFCVVNNDERLGSMGQPVKIMIEDQPVFLCCKGCTKKALKNPEQTLAKAKELRSRKGSTPEKTDFNSKEHSSRRTSGDQEHHNHAAFHGLHEQSVTSHAVVKVGDKVPDFTVRTLDGNSTNLSEIQKDAKQTKSGLVAFSFWCSTCGSCRLVEHQIAKLQKKYAGQAAVLALDANAGETAEGVAAFAKKRALELPIVLDPIGKAADLFGVTRTTTTVVIDGDGVLRYCGQFRSADGEFVDDALNALLAGTEVAVKTTPHNG